MRYDGYTFASPSLYINGGVQSISCKGVAEDGHKRLWIAYDEGTIIINMKTMQPVIPQDQNGEISRILKKAAVRVYCDTKGGIWHVTTDSIFHYSFDEKGYITHTSSCGYEQDMPDVAIKDLEGDGSVWGAIDDGLYHLTISGSNILKETINPSLKKLENFFITDLLKLGSTIWISTNHGLYAYQQFSGEIKQYNHSDDPRSLSHDHVTSLAISPDGDLLVGTLKGLNIMDKTRTFFDHWNSTSDKLPMTSDFVHCILTLDNQIWIGTETAGIVNLSPAPLTLRNYVHKQNDSNSLSPNPVNAMCIDNKGSLWVGTVEGGLNRKREDGTFEHWTTKNSGLTHNSISVLTQDTKGHLWIGTWGGGFHMAETSTRTTINHIDVSAEYVSKTNYIGALAFDKYNDALWIGSNDGIFLYNLLTEKIEKPFEGNETIRGCIGSHIDKNGQLWIGSLYGVTVIDLRAGRDRNNHFTVRQLTNKLDDPSSTVRDKICCFCETSDGTLWLGSNGYGLYRRIIDKETGAESFKALTTADGLANNSVKGVVEDIQGRLWITTLNGLSIFTPTTRTFINYGEKDGLLSQQYYWNSAIKGRHDTFYLGSVKGLTEINSVNEEAVSPIRLTFTALKINNQMITVNTDGYIDEDIVYADKVNLNESDRSLTIEFSSLTYFNETQGQYSYRLKGFENEWNNLPSKEWYVRYTSLKPGNYTLQVMFTPVSNKVNSQTIELDIHVSAYFWKQWWFILICICISGAVIWWIYQQRRKSWKKEEDEKFLIPIKQALSEFDNPEQLQNTIRNILNNQEHIKKSMDRSLDIDKQNIQNDKNFMTRVTEIMEHNYMKSEFGIAEFADSIGMGRSQLSKRLHEETGLSIGAFIRNYRLGIAKDLIRNNSANRNITEIAYRVGFNDPKYFTRCFTKLYGISPSSYKESV